MVTMEDAIQNAQYVVDAGGEKQQVILPFSTWTALIEAWEQLTQLLEDQEDRIILQDWLKQRADGEAHMTSLDDFEQELRVDGLL